MKSIITALFLSLPFTAFADWDNTVITDELTDEKTHYAYVISTDGERSFGVRCNDDVTTFEIVIFFNQFVTTHDYVQISYRIDDNDVVTDTHFTSSDWRAASMYTYDHDNRTKMLNSMGAGRSMYIRAYDFLDQPINMRVSLHGFRDSLIKACARD